MNLRGVVERIEGDHLIILLSDEGLPVKWPRCLLPTVEENDILSFEVKISIPASEARKMNPKSIFECLRS